MPENDDGKNVTSKELNDLQISRINLITDIWADQTLLIRVQPKIEPPDPTIAPPKPMYFLVRPQLIFQREQAGTADFPVLRP
jgi:hypothetical protein